MASMEQGKTKTRMESLVVYPHHLLYFNPSQTSSNKTEGDLNLVTSSFWIGLSHTGIMRDRLVCGH